MLFRHANKRQHTRVGKATWLIRYLKHDIKGTVTKQRNYILKIPNTNKGLSFKGLAM